MMLAVLATVFAVINPADAVFSAAAGSADMQQRLRVATATLYTALIMAGAGPHVGRAAGPLHMFFAPVLPFRRGAVDAAEPGSYDTDTVTVYYVPAAPVQAITNMPVDVADPILRVNDAVCPATADGTTAPLCGFEAGMSVLIFDEAGRYDVFRILSSDGDTVRLTVNRPAASTGAIYPAGSIAAQVVEQTFALRRNVPAKLSQLVSYDGSDRADIPVADHVVALKFEYFGDPRPPEIVRPLDDPAAPWTSYGPRPPPAGARWTSYPEGENCTFTIGADGTPAPRLPVLGGASGGHALVPLTAAQLTDGPWCPDMVSPDRFDADLLRIRAIAVTVRVQAALEALRGPAGVLFLNAGTGTKSSRWVPDQQVRMFIAPRNLNLAR